MPLSAHILPWNIFVYNVLKCDLASAEDLLLAEALTKYHREGTRISSNDHIKQTLLAKIIGFARR